MSEFRFPAARRLSAAAAASVAVIAASVGAQGPAMEPSRIDRLIAQMTLEEKIAMLHGAKDPEPYGQAGYVPAIPRLGIPALRLTDGPAGVRTAQPATALPAPVALASTFSPALAREYGAIMARDARARHQNVLLGPMVNMVRVPQAGRNFETLGEDPLLASRMVAAEVEAIQRAGVIATVKHYALNNQENQRQSVSAEADERTMHEFYLPGFEAAVRAGAGSVMASYNKVHGAWAAENVPLLTDILRGKWQFTGFVMSDWGATHSGAPALTAGMEMEMPGGRMYGALADAVKSGQLPESIVNQAVRRILTAMNDVGLLDSKEPPATAIPGMTPAARDIAAAGAVLLKNSDNVLPLSDGDTIAIIGPTARALLVGGGGSARVQPIRTAKPIEAMQAVAPKARLSYAIGYDVEGSVIPAAALADDRGVHTAIDFIGPKALPAASEWTWAGTITAPVTGDYVLKLQTSGSRATLSVVDPNAPPQPAGRGRGGRGGGASLLPTCDGLTNASTPVRLEAGVPRQIAIAVPAGGTTPVQIRLAWITPESATTALDEAVRIAKSAHTAIVFAYDESTEGRDRASLSLEGNQDALVAAVAAVNPRTVVVLNNGAPIVMPWANRVSSILQMWYPGQEGAEATASLLFGETSPGGKLPVTFPRRAEDAPTALPERYPGIEGRGQYSEGIFVGYRWYDREKIEPLFPFGHGLSYTKFEYANLSVKRAGDGYDVTFAVRNAGSREGTEVAQVYLGPPSSPPVPMAVRSLAGFERVTLAPGRSRQITVHVGSRELSYWSAGTHGWAVARGERAVFVGGSSRDVRLETRVKVS